MYRFLFFLLIFSLFSPSRAMNEVAQNYLEKLRKKEHAALRGACIAGGVHSEIIETIVQFSNDFRNIHAKELFVQKNDNFYHDPQLAEFPMGNSNVVEETKKILKECGINPESISIRYQSKPIWALHNAEACVHFQDLKNFIQDMDQEISLNSLIGKLKTTLCPQELVITEKGIVGNYFWFNHIIAHEASHLLEGHLLTQLLATLAVGNTPYTDLFDRYKYRKEVLADVRRYFLISEQKYLLNALRAQHQFFRKAIKNSTIHPQVESTYKRLQKINQMTWKIPWYIYVHYELGKNTRAIWIGISGLYLICVGIMLWISFKKRSS